MPTERRGALLKVVDQHLQGIHSTAIRRIVIEFVTKPAD
jgi:hypothetical protein